MIIIDKLKEKAKVFNGKYVVISYFENYQKTKYDKTVFGLLTYHEGDEQARITYKISPTKKHSVTLQFANIVNIVERPKVKPLYNAEIRKELLT